MEAKQGMCGQRLHQVASVPKTASYLGHCFEANRRGECTRVQLKQDVFVLLYIFSNSKLVPWDLVLCNREVEGICYQILSTWYLLPNTILTHWSLEIERARCQIDSGMRLSKHWSAFQLRPTSQHSNSKQKRRRWRDQKHLQSKWNLNSATGIFEPCQLLGFWLLEVGSYICVSLRPCTVTTTAGDAMSPRWLVHILWISPPIIARKYP